MVLREKALRLVLVVGLAGLATPVLARQPAMDAEGRVFGDTIDDTIDDPLPAWKQGPVAEGQPPLPPIPSAYDPRRMDQRDMQRVAWEDERANWLTECRCPALGQFRSLIRACGRSVPS